MDLKEAIKSLNEMKLNVIIHLVNYKELNLLFIALQKQRAMLITSLANKRNSKGQRQLKIYEALIDTTFPDQVHQPFRSVIENMTKGLVISKSTQDPSPNIP